MVKNPPVSAGDMNSTPGLGRSYLPWQLSPMPRPLSLCAAVREAATRRSLSASTKSSPCSPQLEKANVKATKTQHSRKNKKYLSCPSKSLGLQPTAFKRVSKCYCSGENKYHSTCGSCGIILVTFGSDVLFS